jgi:two-component system response regulator QseB
MENPGRILSKAQLEGKLYGWDMENESNTIEVHIHGLRRKLGKDAVITVRHVGYKVAEK